MISEQDYSFYESQEPHLSAKHQKIIAVKLQKSIVDQINQLCREGYYVSLSETTRVAINDFVGDLAEIQRQGGQFIDDSTFFKGTKEEKTPISVKVPYLFHEKITQLIKDFNFRDRSKFIRAALIRFLNDDSWHEIFKNDNSFNTKTVLEK